MPQLRRWDAFAPPPPLICDTVAPRHEKNKNRTLRMSFIHVFSCFPQHLCYGSPFLLPMSVSCLLVGNDLFGSTVPPEPRYCCVAPWLAAGWLVGCCVVPGRQAGLLLCCTWLAGWLAGWVAGCAWQWFHAQCQFRARRHIVRRRHASGLCPLTRTRQVT